MGLREWGWTDDRRASFTQYAAAGLVPGRVVSQGRGALFAETSTGSTAVIIQRGFRRDAFDAEDFPQIGDWLALQPVGAGEAALREILPRHSAFVRRGAGPNAGAQVVAVNVDTVLLVSALTRDLNLRRLERYLTLAWSSGARPIIVLNKADLCDDLAARTAAVAQISGGAPVLVLSAHTGLGMEQLIPELTPGSTICLLGSSGVGKSTLTNALLGEERQIVRDVREDDHRGRHTTSSRELFILPTGALLIDTPGMREIGMWEAEGGLETTFADVDALALTCRFSDCRHEMEPGCSVLAAISSGRLERERLMSHRKLERELASQERRHSPAQSRAESRRFARMVRLSCRTRARMRGEEP